MPTISWPNWVRPSRSESAFSNTAQGASSSRSSAKVISLCTPFARSSKWRMGPNTGPCTFFTSGLKRQIKTGLGKFADDPDRYIEVFQGLTQSFELAWKDVMLLLEQTLTISEKNKVLENAQSWRDDLVCYNCQRQMRRGMNKIPHGVSSSSSEHPNWSF